MQNTFAAAVANNKQHMITVRKIWSKALNPLLSNFCNKTQLSDEEFNTNGFSDSFLEDNFSTDESSYAKKKENRHQQYHN